MRLLYAEENALLRSIHHGLARHEIHHGYHFIEKFTFSRLCLVIRPDH